MTETLHPWVLLQRLCSEAPSRKPQTAARQTAPRRHHARLGKHTLSGSAANLNRKLNHISVTLNQDLR